MRNPKNNLSQKLTKRRSWFKICLSKQVQINPKGKQILNHVQVFKKKRFANLKQGVYNYIMKTKKEMEREIQIWLKARKQVRVGSKMYFNISSRIHKLKIKLEGK